MFIGCLPDVPRPLGSKCQSPFIDHVEWDGDYAMESLLVMMTIMVDIFVFTGFRILLSIRGVLLVLLHLCSRKGSSLPEVLQYHQVHRR